MFALAAAQRRRDPLCLGRGSARRVRFLEPAGLPRHLLRRRRRAADARGFPRSRRRLFRSRRRRRRASMPRSSSIRRPIPTAASRSATVIEGLLDGMADAEARHGLTSKLILCFLRHLSTRTRPSRRWPRPSRGSTGSPASGSIRPRSAIRRRSSRACSPPPRAKGLKLVAHAGEEGPPEYVHEALDLLAHRPARPRQPQPGRPRPDRAAGARGHDADGLPAVERQAVQRRVDRRRTRSTAMLRTGPARDDQFGRSGLFRRLYRRQFPRGRARAATSTATTWRRWRATASSARSCPTTRSPRISPRIDAYLEAAA